MKWLHTHFPTLTIIGLPFILLLILFRSLLSQIETALFDWNDYPLYIWIMYQNIEHLTQLDFAQFFNGAIFYPATNTLLFSDLFLPQSLLALPLTLVIHNPVLVFNIIFFTSLLLNIISAKYFWSTFFKNWHQLLFATITTVISSFIFQNWYHFQMMSLWPFLFALGFFFKSSYTWKRAVGGGLLLSLVFYSSIYYWVFLITTLTMWFLLKVGWQKYKKIQIANFITYCIVAFSVFILVSGVTLFNYWQTRHQYHAQREYGEYITYSAHLSDYIFPAHMSSALWGTKLVRRWNQFNQHSGVFPGLAITSLGIVGAVSLTRKKNVTLGIELSFEKTFFLALILTGLIFSLGPRFNFNGQFLSIPLPYHLLLKINPLFEVVRVTSRWSILLFLGLIFFATKGLGKVSKQTATHIAVAAILIHLIEVYPLSWSFGAKEYYPGVNAILSEQCHPNSKVLLEYPITQYKPGVTIVTNLTYRTQMMLASIKHNCTLINGYTGYIPKDFELFEHTLFWSVQNQDRDEFLQLLSQRQTQLIKLNKKELYTDHRQIVEKWVGSDPAFTVLYTDNEYLVVNYGQN